MRQALGLGEGSPQHRQQSRNESEHRGRRFVKDGQVPVVVLSSKDHSAEAAAPVNRAAAAEAALRGERALRDRAERALQQAQATLQQLQTKLAHAELAHGEALAAERQRREAAEQALQDSQVARAALQEQLDLQVRARPEPEPPAEAPSGRRPRRRVMKPRMSTDATARREPKPVKWWLPGFATRPRPD
jgi:hypothetical protein